MYMELNKCSRRKFPPDHSKKGKNMLVKHFFFGLVKLVCHFKKWVPVLKGLGTTGLR